ncbi:MAG: peptidoglycan-binding domain-containing protein [Candidatus Omnitrophota bacterium]|nr:peptidoglycan-binding domain-containing protein [Candidatus Omnitrophota bacterium]
MKKCLVVVLVVLAGLYIFGCGKKEVTESERQAVMTMEGLSTMELAGPVTSETKALEPKTAETQTTLLKPLPLAEPPYKPLAAEIQTCLKNAGYYAGEIDGKIGPMTKKAIKDFQEANNLEADGKVGPKTWEALSKNLNQAPVPTKKRR